MADITISVSHGSFSASLWFEHPDQRELVRQVTGLFADDEESEYNGNLLSGVMRLAEGCESAVRKVEKARPGTIKERIENPATSALRHG